MREVFAWILVALFGITMVWQWRAHESENSENAEILYGCGVALEAHENATYDLQQCCADVYLDRAYAITDEIGRVCSDNGWTAPLGWADFDEDEF